MSTSNAPAPSAVTALTERINKLTGQVSLHESAITRSTRTTGTIGLIALLLMTAYFYYGYVMIGGLLEPHMLVPYATRMLEQNLPSAREALVKQISDSAPAWAQQVSLKAQEAIPELRGKLENYVLTETDKLAGQVTSLTEEKFRKAMQDNRETIEKGFKELASSDKLSEESLAALVTALEQELRTDMLAQSELVLETLRFLSRRVQKLSVGSGLDEEERCERRIAMIARRLQLTEADPRPITMPEFKKSAAEKDAKAVSETEQSDAKPSADDGKTPAKDDKPEAKADKPEAKTGDESK